MSFIKSSTFSAIVTVFFMCAGCSMHKYDAFEIVDTKSGTIIDKIEYVSNEEWKHEYNSGMPAGWTSGNFIMDGIVTYIHSSMYGTTRTYRSGSTYAYLIHISDEEQIRVLSKYSGFDINERVNVLFGNSQVRISVGEKCP